MNAVRQGYVTLWGLRLRIPRGDFLFSGAGYEPGGIGCTTRVNLLKFLVSSIRDKGRFVFYAAAVSTIDLLGKAPLVIGLTSRRMLDTSGR